MIFEVINGDAEGYTIITSERNMKVSRFNTMPTILALFLLGIGGHFLVHMEI